MRRAPFHTVGGLALAMVIVGCGPAAEPTQSESVIASPRADTETATEPPVEESKLESPEGGAEEIALELPGLPIGGSPTLVSDTLQCVEVNWSGPPPVPEGLQIRVAGISFEPSDAFALSDETCPDGDDVLCVSQGFSFGAEGPACTVPVTWTDATLNQPGRLFFSAGVVTCPPDASEACAQFRDAVVAGGGEGIELDPPPAQSPHENDEPTDEATDEPTDEPTDEATDEATG